MLLVSSSKRTRDDDACSLVPPLKLRKTSSTDWSVLTDRSVTMSVSVSVYKVLTLNFFLLTHHLVYRSLSY